MREPHSDQMVRARLNAKLHGYHDYMWKEDLPPVWHSDVSLTYIKRIIYRSRVPVIEAPRVEGVRVPFNAWRHIFQVKDQSTLTDTQGQWCFLLAEKDDVQFEGKVHNTWYDRRRSLAIHFTLPGHLTFPSGFIMPWDLINLYGAPPPPWRVYFPLANGHTLLQEEGISWMYSQFESHSVGLKPPLPGVNHLPFIDSPGVTHSTTFHPSSKVPSHSVSVGIMAVPHHSFISTRVMTVPRPASITVAKTPRHLFGNPWPDTDTDGDRSSATSVVAVDNDLPAPESSRGAEEGELSEPVNMAGADNSKAHILGRSTHELHDIALRLESIIAESEMELDHEVS
ncbi:hypothetical protein EV421DRAFT_1903110 [Armillaria borealis]|uniref:Uncharacterized protein n=1 Tax=Armillaria borealis TaxID=47425 RepID=A0AA39MSK7_9AGAR|nr:hypothetical protein EV421DRAFT_1903110 [Armillaria borealis]